MQEIVKLSSPQYADKNILPQNIILSDYIDWDSRQSFDDFCNTSDIKFISYDFCIKADSEVLKKLKEKGKIDLSEIESVGWFDKSINAQNWNSFQIMNPNAFRNFDGIRTNSFSQFKKHLREALELDIIKGGLLLAWHYNKKIYEDFFSKIEWKHDNKWTIYMSELNNSDIKVLSQLYVINSNKNKIVDVGSNQKSTMMDLILENIIDPKDDNTTKILRQNFLLYQHIIHLTLEYLIKNNGLEKEHYIDFLISKEALFKNKDFSEELLLLKEFHIRQIGRGDFKHPIIKRLNNILSVTDSEIEEIDNLEDFKEAELFIIGMVKTATKIQEKLEPNKIAYFCLEVIADYLIDFKPRASKDIIHLNFDSSSVEKDIGNKFSFLRESFGVFTYKKKLLPSLDRLKEENKDLKQQIIDEKRRVDTSRRKLSSLSSEYDNLVREMANMTIGYNKAKETGKIVNYEKARMLLDEGEDWDKFKDNVNKAFKEKETWEQFCNDFLSFENANDHFDKILDGTFKKSVKNREYIINTVKESIAKEDKKSDINESKTNTIKHTKEIFGEDEDNGDDAYIEEAILIFGEDEDNGDDAYIEEEIFDKHGNLEGIRKVKRK